MTEDFTKHLVFILAMNFTLSAISKIVKYSSLTSIGDQVQRIKNGFQYQKVFDVLRIGKGQRSMQRETGENVMNAEIKMCKIIQLSDRDLEPETRESEESKNFIISCCLINIIHLTR